MKIKILESAMQDLEIGFKFYERQEADLGSYFLDSLFSDIDSLQVCGGIHRTFFGKHRALSKRFPFALYYTATDGVVQIHAVIDCRQNPRRISRKLK